MEKPSSASFKTIWTAARPASYNLKNRSQWSRKRSTSCSPVRRRTSRKSGLSSKKAARRAVNWKAAVDNIKESLVSSMKRIPWMQLFGRRMSMQFVMFKKKRDLIFLRKSFRRLVASLAQIRIDLEREKQGTADLRREVQSYINHVKQVETVLARKVSFFKIFSWAILHCCYI